MNAVTGKIKSKSGISLAIALVFFLLCAAVGTVVLSAASVSAGNTARERRLYRETAALTSAAELLRGDITGMTYTGAYTRNEIVTTTVDPAGEQSTKVVTEEQLTREIPTLENSRFFRARKNADGTYSDNLHLTERYFINQGNPALSDGVETAPTAQTVLFHAVEEQNIPQVTAAVTVEEDYTLTATLQCGENTMTVTFPPHAAVQTQVAEPVIKRLNDDSTQKITATTYSTVLTWGEPIMKEGGGGGA